MRWVPRTTSGHRAGWCEEANGCSGSRLRDAQPLLALCRVELLYGVFKYTPPRTEYDISRSSTSLDSLVIGR